MVKYLLYPVIIVLTMTLAAPALCGVKTSRGDIVSLRAGRHSNFHRLVIELSHEAMYRVKKFDKVVEIVVLDVDSSDFRPGFTATRFFRLKKISTETRNGALVTRLRLNLNGPAEIRDKIVQRPYRIVVDMYPEKNTETLLTKKKVTKKNISRKIKSRKAVARKAVHKKVVAKKAVLKKAGPMKPLAKYSHKASHKDTFAFNEGWRWVYRKMAVEHLKTSFYESLPDYGYEMLREYLALKGGNPWADGKEAEAYVKRLDEQGEAARAVTLRAIIALMKNNEDLLDVESDIVKTPENDLTPLARFLLASTYEREGLYPEASAYYALAYKAKTLKILKSRAALGSGRVNYFSGSMVKSMRWFERARQEGSHEALGWLAGTLLLKGEFRSAWAAYGRLGETKDPFILLGLADMKMRRGEYKGARLLFKELKIRFMQEPFLMSFFGVREADAMLASGLVKEGISAYVSMKKLSTGVGLILSELALADYYAGDGAELLKAKALYQEVAKSRGPGSGEAFIRLAEILERLKAYDEAMKNLDEISPENTLSARRDMAGFLRSRVAYNWIADLYSKKKWLDVATVNYRYGGSITFGKRAENYLRVGEALIRLGLTPDAVKALNKAEKIGRKEIKVRAVLLLTRLYLDQRDGSAAANVLEDLRASYTEAARLSKWKGYYIEALFLKGNYREVIRLSRGREEGAFILMRAAAYKGLGMWSEAKESYSRAMTLYKKNKDRRGLLRAETGYADSQFLSRGFVEAIEAYGVAAETAAKVSTDTERWLRYRLSLSYTGAGMREKAKSTIRELKRSDRSYGAWAEALQMAQPGG